MVGSTVGSAMGSAVGSAVGSVVGSAVGSAAKPAVGYNSDSTPSVCACRMRSAPIPHALGSPCDRVIVEAQLPPPAAKGVTADGSAAPDQILDGAADQAADGTADGVADGIADGIAIAAALRIAIDTGSAAMESHVADAHLNTWWHPLQRQLDFGSGQVHA